MRILVTGGGGFLGGEIVRQLRERGDEVVVLSRNPPTHLQAEGITTVSADLADAPAVSQAVKGCHAVIHTAARAGVWGAYAAYHRTNVIGTESILSACREQGVRFLVHTSTPSVVYNGKPFAGEDESLPLGTKFPCAYPATKAEAERIALAANDPDGLRVCALRPHLIYGVGDPHLLPRVVDRARTGRLRIVGDGTNCVDVTHVRDAARAHLQALDALQAGLALGQAYFLSQGKPVSLWPWINDLLERLEMPPVTRRVPVGAALAAGALAEGIWSLFRLSGEPPMTRFVAVELAKDHWYTIAAAKRDLGYEPQVTSEDGLAEYAEAWKSNRTPTTPQERG